MNNISSASREMFTMLPDTNFCTECRKEKCYIHIDKSKISFLSFFQFGNSNKSKSPYAYIKRILGVSFLLLKITQKFRLKFTYSHGL